MRIEYKKPTDETWIVSSEDATSPHIISGLEAEDYQVRGFSSTAGYSDIIMKAANGNDSLLSSYYVRPSGQTYGTGDGLSYDNAWSGFGAIEWGQLGSNTRLYVCGTHNETLDVMSNDSIINGDYPSDLGIIDCTNTLNSGIVISSKNNITLNKITSLNSVTNGILIEGISTGIITNNCEFSGSGNQGIQHLNSVSATHNNPICKNNLDDGISGHDDAVIVVNGGIFENNDQGINIIANTHLTLNGPVTFTGNISYDLWAAQSTAPGSCVININDTSFAGKAYATSDAVINFDNCILANNVFNGNINIYNSICSNHVYPSGAVYKYYNSIITIENTTVVLGRSVEFTDCRVLGNINLTGSITANRTIFDGTGVVDMNIDVRSEGVLDVKYCIFKNMTSTQFGVATRDGGTASIRNSNFIGNNNVGDGVYAAGVTIIDNCIFFDLGRGIYKASTGTGLFNNCCFFDVTTPKSGTITSNNEVVGDPLFVDVANENYSLLAGSSCIDTGLDTGFPEGIDTADWGDSETVPVVTTKNQDSLYDIGAYVYN